MSYLKKKKKQNRFIHSVPFLLLLLVLIFLVTKGTWNIYKKERNTNENLENVIKNLEETKNREAILRNQIEILETEKGLETEIRDRFDVVKEGEKVIIILDKKEKEEITHEEGGGIWGWIKNLFK